MRTPKAEVADFEFTEALQQEMDLGVKSLKQGNPDMALAFFKSARRKVSPDLPFFDHLTHNLLLAAKSRIEQLLFQNKIEEGKSLLAEALSLQITGNMANDAEFLRVFADAYQNLGLVFFQNLLFQESVDCCRKAISILPCPTYHINLTNALSILKQPARLADYTTRVTPERLGTHIFIACVPKSASTFLKNVLVGLTGFKDLFAVHAAGQNEHDLYLPSISEYADRNTVTQQHCRASEANVQMMQAFEIRPVVLVRNVFDAVASLLDFYRQGAYFNSYFRADFLSLDEETQIDLLIDNVVPWYLQFVASWELVEKEKRLDIHWLAYEDFTRDKSAAIKNLLEFYGFGVSAASVARTIEKEESDARRNRFNKGVAGRGKAVLTDAQKKRIKSFTKYHPSTDFGRLGL